MRYRVEHTTRYAYGTPVELAAHMVHLRPRPRPWQTVISEQITTAPMPARRRDGLDHFGNHVTWLFLDLPHADGRQQSGAHPSHTDGRSLPQSVQTTVALWLTSTVAMPLPIPIPILIRCQRR